MKSISAILLAAGASKRMGRDKLTLAWRRETILEHCLETLLHSRAKEVVVVLGGTTARLSKRLERSNVKVVMNPYRRRGMSTSIRAGVLVLDRETEGILIALGDQPLLKSRTVDALIRAFETGKRSIVIPSFHGRRGHPVIFDRIYEEELLRLKGDQGAKSIVEHHHGEVRFVAVRSEGAVRDIDTPEDYRKATQ
jgi:molybdenum cofactor cytidylyltransferase